MKFKKYLVYLVLTLTLCFSSLSLFAGSNTRSIRAQLDRGFSYQLDNNPILRNTPAIKYRGNIYIPIESLTRALGYNISINGDTISITRPSASPSPSPSPTSTQSPIETYKVVGNIVGIDFPTNRIIIVPANQSNDSPISIFVTPDTSIVDAKTKQRYSFSDLDTDMTVNVTYTTRSTKSLPPIIQNVATEIIVLSKPSNIQPR